MKVLKKQTNSKMCLICGLENKLGLHASFYEMEDNSVYSIVEFKNEHQSYPDRCHGGMISSLLDEIIGRAIWIKEPLIWGVTIELNVKFRKQVPLNTKLKCVGKIEENKKRIFSGTGYIYDLEGNLLCNATATYLKVKDFGMPLKHEEVNILIEDDVKEID